MSGRGSATVVESVQRHSGRAMNSEEGGPVDYSLASIDLKKVRHALADVIQNNKDRWKELSVQELARKELEREREMSLDSEEMLTDLEPEPLSAVSHSAPPLTTTTTTSPSRTQQLHTGHNNTHSSIEDCSSSQECLSSAEPVHASASAPAGSSPGSPLPVSPERESSAQAHMSEPLPWNGEGHRPGIEEDDPSP